MVSRLSPGDSAPEFDLEGAGFLVAWVHPRSVLALAKGFMPGKMEGDKTLLPADFLIDARGRIGRAFYASNITEHLSLAEMDAWVEGEER